MKVMLSAALQESNDMFHPFCKEELEEHLKDLKAGRASGLDGITTDMIQYFGPRSPN